MTVCLFLQVWNAVVHGLLHKSLSHARKKKQPKTAKYIINTSSNQEIRVPHWIVHFMPSAPMKSTYCNSSIKSSPPPPLGGEGELFQTH